MMIANERCMMPTCRRCCYCCCFLFWHWHSEDDPYWREPYICMITTFDDSDGSVQVMDAGKYIFFWAMESVKNKRR